MQSSNIICNLNVKDCGCSELFYTSYTVKPLDDTDGMRSDLTLPSNTLSVVSYYYSARYFSLCAV